ncbi:hypothetical protein MUK42_07455 [Musa troglodytarum]|uniref:Uncharacterized protein n=1 Tax=Musa troglodytarum TaxID=320322 RepID=A0A9E7FJJ2_9LILI|nr:hypothetical protein MUK42_07455 [Musa troglodytarum]
MRVPPFGSMQGQAGEWGRGPGAAHVPTPFASWIPQPPPLKSQQFLKLPPQQQNCAMSRSRDYYSRNEFEF